MIETSLLKEDPPVVYHRVSGNIRTDEASDGANKAMSVINSIVKNNIKFDLVIDMRGYIFDDLVAHRIWALEFKEQKILKENAARIAIIGDYAEKFKAEKELMESAILKFFTDLDAAYSWLKLNGLGNSATPSIGIRPK